MVAVTPDSHGASRYLAGMTGNAGRSGLSSNETMDQRSRSRLACAANCARIFLLQAKSRVDRRQALLIMLRAPM